MSANATSATADRCGHPVDFNGWRMCGNDRPCEEHDPPSAAAIRKRGRGVSDHVHVWLSCCDICGIVSPNAVLLRDKPEDRERLADALDDWWINGRKAGTDGVDAIIAALRREA